MKPRHRQAGRASSMLWLLLLTAVPGGGAEAAAENILLHGRIYTLDPARPWAEALAIGGGRILAVGSDAQILRLAGPRTLRIDLGGHLLTPGLIDSHVHFIDGARYLRQVALRDAATMADVAHRVDEYRRTHPRADWIQGEGWSYGYPDLPRGEFHKELIDAVSGGHPVFLDSSMAHAAWVNSAALRRAGITRDTPDPPGGEIVRGVDGEPTGWLKEEAAIRLVQARIPAAGAGETRATFIAGMQAANRLGLTRVDSAGGDFPLLGLMAELARAGRLTLRFSVADWINPPGLTQAKLAALEAARKRYHGGFISCCVAKFLLDGVIESHTAYLPGGYADAPSTTGMRFFEPDAYMSAVRTLNEHGFQVYTHAIGDGAIKLALDAYGQQPDPPAARNRIEHAEAPDPADIPRFASLGVIASMQPLMIYPRDEWKGMEGLWQRYAGDRFLATAFPIRALLEAHARVAFGTDWPVVQLNPLLGIRNAVLRQSLDGQPAGGYVPAQRIDVAAALRAYTRDAAYASRVDRDEGSIEPGKRADLTEFSGDFLDGPSSQIAAGRVLRTIVGGRTVYRAP